MRRQNKAVTLPQGLENPFRVEIRGEKGTHGGVKPRRRREEQMGGHNNVWRGGNEGEMCTNDHVPTKPSLLRHGVS